MRMVRNNFKEISFYLKNKVFRNPVYKSYLSCLKNEESFSKLQIEEINFQKRVKLLKFVYENIPFYKDFYRDHNVDINKITKKEYWKEIPVLEKHHLRSYKQKFINKNLNENRFIKTRTGGSTGEPLEVYRDKGFPEEIIKWRMLRRWSLNPAENVVMFWRIPEYRASMISKIKNKLIWWPTKRLSVDVSSLSKDKMMRLTKKINTDKPFLFWGYVGAIEQYCQFLLNENIKLIYKPRCVWTTAAPLSKLQENIIGKALTTKILNQYACSEMHWIAANTPETKQLIIDYDYRHIDIIDQKGNYISDFDCYGDLLITDLENYAFPLIKYRVGDRGAFAKPDSDAYLNFPRIHPVKGRKTDYIITKSNRIISGEFLTTIFDDYINKVKQFQIHQLNEKNVLIKLVLYQSDNNEFIKKIENILEKVSNNEINFQFSIVEKISSDKGKIRFIINDLLKK